MRERKGSGFGRRSVASESKQAIKKYFLLYEGSDTEVLYFDAIEDMRKEIELNSLIELVPIIRCFSEEGWSNPRKILDRVIQDLKERDTGTISFKTLFDKIIDYFHEKQIIINSKVLKRAIWKTMKQICEEEFEKTLEDIIDDPEFVCNKVLTELGQKYKIDNIIQYIPEIIKFEDLTYEENYDEICLIVDRDKESFIESQYEYVIYMKDYGKQTLLSIILQKFPKFPHSIFQNFNTRQINHSEMIRLLPVKSTTMHDQKLLLT